MRILIDIGHPAHVHFFYHPIQLLRQHGHDVLITSRDKDIALSLLDELGLHHEKLSTAKNRGLVSMARELVQRNLALWRVVRRYRPDVMAAIGGINIAQVGWITRTPSAVFYDTENARLQNALTYPFASSVLVPACYEGWLPRRRHHRYAGYHELSYLHPQRFAPNREIAIANGLSVEDDTFFIRVVAWRASHDIGERGWTSDLLRRVVGKLSDLGKVIISSETELPSDLAVYRYSGKRSAVHHLLAFSRAFVGESATMASECAVLGVPAIYAAETPRGYTNEQDRKYGLVTNVPRLEWPALNQAIDRILSKTPDAWQEQRHRLLADTIDVAEFVTEKILSLPLAGRGPSRDPR